MSNKLKHKKIENTLDDEIENLSIEEIDESINEFYIDKEKIDSIKPPEDMKNWISESIDRAEIDMKAQKIKKYITRGAASIAIILAIGVYSPALAYGIPFVKIFLENINDALRVDEFASYIGINKIIPKVITNENNKIQIQVLPDYKVNKIEELPDEEKKKTEGNILNTEVVAPASEYLEVQLIHKMSNSIIKAIDNRKYGEVEITPQNIDKAIEGLKYIEDEGCKSYLYNELSKWKNGNFSNGVFIHNFVWDMLNGEIGKAISVNNEKVESIKNTYFR